jgi:hypothetical protein
VDEGEYGECILYAYIKIMKPVEIVLRRGAGKKRENNGCGESKIYCKHTCKFYNVSPIQLYILINCLKKLMDLFSWSQRCIRTNSANYSNSKKCYL